ncbi:hypothetical protein FISHEDRAFT_64425 [Fistulina hepatica ATCC 64428]|nr:hypothetical protein FISHEDRAFT_64425 [Fistulina hepatica ATCC 64428]
MLLPWPLITLLISVLAYGEPAKRTYDTHNYYVIQHDPRSSASLADVTRALGVEVVEMAGELRDHWLVRAEKPAAALSARNTRDDPVVARYRHITSQPHTARSEYEDIATAIKYFDPQVLRQRHKRAPPPVSDASSNAVAQRMGIEDPLFGEQWHLVNDEFPEHSMNVVPVWDMGFTGKGVISSLVDDGLDYTSEDLKDNFDADNSYDFNDHEKLPTPKLSDDHHGTRCAGQVGAGKNKACGMGIAYESKVAGVRILSGPITDVDEAASLNYGYQNVSIYSCSWGPPDNGQSMEGPSHLIKKAVLNGINNGRSGLGSIFVFASGNGAAHQDQCNFDGYTNSIYSVTVSAIDNQGQHPYYSEPCAANMIVAYSSGSSKHIVTTDKGINSCSKTHGGTSAAAPNAVGVFALALEARPDLTWRDIQYLCVQTARRVNPTDPDWEETANGGFYSYKYGFGALDAEKFVTAALTWTLVPPQARMITETVVLDDGAMTPDGRYSGGRHIPEGGLTSVITITEEMTVANNLGPLEHINVKVWIDHQRRGDVEVEIRSPKGIRSVLGAPRKSDNDKSGYPGWTFMSVKHWGEDGVGDWTIKVSDQGPDKANGSFLGWNMILWGVALDASKAVLYEDPSDDPLLPPYDDAPAPPVPTTTKQIPKPTVPPHPSSISTSSISTSSVAVPTDQDDAVEATVTSSSSLATATPSHPASIPTADEGWFSDMSKLVSNQKWFFGALGAVILFGAGAAVFFLRRRVARRQREQYTTLPAGDDVQMRSIGGEADTTHGGRTRELYDAFGEVSDDDEDDADEQTHLRGAHDVDLERGGLGFHSGFLEDDESSPVLPQPQYRDDPEDADHQRTSGDAPDDAERTSDRAASSASGDGSWVHARAA